MATEKELDQELTELGHMVERLRVHYQSYFLGIEKRPPTLLRDQLERRVRQSALNEVKRANIKFRFQSVVQKYRTYEVYWDRVQRDIEEGRVVRDAISREASRGEGAAVAPNPAPGPSQPVPPGPAQPAAAPPARDPAGGPEAPRAGRDLPLPADPVHRLFVSYLDARQSLGLSVQGITEPSFRAGLEKQRQIQTDRLGVREVAFEVAVKEGKVILLARPVIR